MVTNPPKMTKHNIKVVHVTCVLNIKSSENIIGLWELRLKFTLTWNIRMEIRN